MFIQQLKAIQKQYIGLFHLEDRRYLKASEAIKFITVISRSRYIPRLSFRNTRFILKFFYQPIRCTVDLSPFISHYLYTKISSVCSKVYTSYLIFNLTYQIIRHIRVFMSMFNMVKTIALLYGYH